MKKHRVVHSLFEAYDILDAERVKGKVYRGMSEAEFFQALDRGYLLSDQRFCARGEGTCFAEIPADALSYAAYGPTDPQKTGRAVYVVEVEQGRLSRTRDGYYKSELPVALEGGERVFRLGPHTAGYTIEALTVRK